MCKVYDPMKATASAHPLVFSSQISNLQSIKSDQDRDRESWLERSEGEETVKVFPGVSRGGREEGRVEAQMVQLKEGMGRKRKERE